LFLYFFEVALNYLKRRSRVGYITSGTYMNVNGAKPFRQFMSKNVAYEHIINFGENQPFIGAEMVYPTIAIVRKDKPGKTFKSKFIDGVVPFGQLKDFVQED